MTPNDAVKIYSFVCGGYKFVIMFVTISASPKVFNVFDIMHEKTHSVGNLPYSLNSIGVTYNTKHKKRWITFRLLLAKC